MKLIAGVLTFSSKREFAFFKVKRFSFFKLLVSDLIFSVCNSVESKSNCS